MNTPWGTSQSATKYGDGITFYETASHGGFHVRENRNAAMPDALRQDDGWYEEDCEACKVILAFPLHFSPKQVDGAQDTLKNWYPALYEQFYNVILRPGESMKRDEETFYREHAQDLIVVCAFGDWKEGVPKGMVGVCATVGGSRSPHAMQRYFLVPGGEYSAFRFVIDPQRHQETGEVFAGTKEVSL